MTVPEKRQGDIYWSMFGVLSLVGVVVQGDEVEARLDLFAASSKHVLPARALSCVGVTAVEGKRSFHSDYELFFLPHTPQLYFSPVRCLSPSCHGNATQARMNESVYLAPSQFEKN